MATHRQEQERVQPSLRHSPPESDSESGYGKRGRYGEHGQRVPPGDGDSRPATGYEPKGVFGTKVNAPSSAQDGGQDVGDAGDEDVTQAAGSASCKVGGQPRQEAQDRAMRRGPSPADLK